jgi:pSer/pThr/pTyr-binding forkhead associated (FHA) protein
MSKSNEDRTVMMRSESRKDSGKANAAPVKQPANPDGRLICLDPSQVDGGKSEVIVPLKGGMDVTVGRGDMSTFMVASRKLSRQHARLFSGEGSWGIEDLNSTNGVYVNGHKISTIWLKHKDEVRLGSLAFSFELDRPPAAGQQAGGRPVPASHDDDMSERTMMVGSLGAGKAVLEAVRKVDTPVRLKVEEEEEDSDNTGRDWSGLRRTLVIVAVVAVVLAGLGAAGAIWYPIHKKQQFITQTIDHSAQVRKRVIDRAAQFAAGNQTMSFDQDLNDLAETIADSGRLLASEPNAMLADSTARMKFLTFEREFLPLLGKGDIKGMRMLTERLSADLEATAARVPADAEHGQADGLLVVRELAKLARILIDFRVLSLEYPQVSKLAPAQPKRERIQALDAAKLDFTRIRRETNRYLSVDYVVFNTAVKTVEERDLALLNQWKEFLGSNPG